ncbi:hypothetical protein ACWEPF_39635, partial [Kitasatospora sp. NPDC004289]
MAGNRAPAEAGDAGFLELTAGRAVQLYRTACLLTGGDSHLAEDLVQETLARMYTIWRRQNSWLSGRSRIEDPVSRLRKAKGETLTLDWSAVSGFSLAEEGQGA